MKKKTIKKVAKQFHLWMKFNDTIFETDTDDLEEAIMSFKPKSLKTKILFKITDKDGKFCERQVFVQRGKMLWRNAMFLRTFIRFLIFKNA